MIISRRFIPFLLMLITLALATGGCSKAARRDRYMAKADRDFQNLRYDEAEIEYRNALRVSPLDAAAIRQLGFIYYEQGRVRQAFGFLLKAKELDTNNVDIRIKLALMYAGAQKAKEAAEEANWVLNRQPDNEDALAVLATTAITPKDIQSMEQRLEKQHQQSGDTAAYHVALGMIRFQEKKIQEAKNELSKAIALNPKSATAYAALGGIYLIQQDMKKAGECFKSAAELSPIRSSKRMKYIDFAFRSGATNEAQQALEEIRSKAPDYIPALTYSMERAFARQNFDECAKDIQKILAREPQDYEALLTSGSLQLAQGDADKALTQFKQLASIYDKVPQVYYQLALANLQKQDAATARDNLNHAIALQKDYPEAILLLSEMDVRKGDVTPAIVSLTQLTKQHPQIIQAHLLLATAFLTQNNLDGALVEYRRTAELFPKNPEVPLLIGLVLIQQKNFSAARKSFEQVIEIAPNYLPAVEQLINLDLAEGNSAAALQRANDIIAKNPKAAEPLLLLAKIHLAETNQAAAETDLLKAIDANPDFRTPYLLLSQLYESSGKQQQALEKLNSWLAKTNDAATLMRVGMIQNEMGNYSAARDAYEKLLTINPNFSAALNNLAYLYSEKFNQLDKATDMAERARQLLPYDPFTADTLGWILFKKGDYVRALSLLRESASKLPGQSEVQFHLGMAQYMTGDEDAARTSLQNAVNGTDNFSGKDEARRRLEILAINPLTANSETLAMLEKSLRDLPGDPAVQNRLAAIYERDGNDEKAANIYEAALKTNPNNSQMMFKLAQFYATRSNSTAKALDLAKSAHNLSPENPNISHGLSELVFKTGDFKWALSLMQDVALKQPNQPDVFYDLAWSYYSVGRVTDAEATMKSALQKGLTGTQADDAKRFLAMVEAFKSSATSGSALAQKILEADGNYVPALMVIAHAQEQHGEYKSAKDVYEKVLDRFPLFAPAARQLTFLYADQLGDERKAYEMGLKARDLFSSDVELTRMLGILAYRQGDFVKSLQFLQDYARLHPNEPEITAYIGLAQYRLKDLARSKAMLQSVVNSNLPPKLATEAKQVLAELK